MKKLTWWDYRKNIWEVFISYLTFTSHDKNKIPINTLYCYTTKGIPSKENGYTHKITPCPYYVSLPNGYNHCKFLKTTTDDFLFDDQCKICDISVDN